MATKKVSYKNLLKEAISEFDTSKTVEVKGPMLDPVLSWDGGGEIPTHKDAASILERYYFNEDQDETVEIEEGEYNDDGKPDSGASMKNAKGAGTEQAGTSDGAMDKREEEIAKEQEEVATEQDEKKDEEEEEKAAEAAPEEEVKEDEEVTEDIENAVIEKLIAEMEEEDEEEKPEEGAEEEVKEDAEVAAELDMTYTGEGPKPGMEAPKEKQQKDTEQDAQGVGTQQAGTGVDAGQVPDRKDMADTFVKPAKVAQEQDAAAAVKPEEDEEEELDVDKEVTKEDAVQEDEPAPGAQHGHTHGAPLGIKGQDDDEVEESLEQAFKIFSEAIEDESE